MSCFARLVSSGVLLRGSICFLEYLDIQSNCSFESIGARRCAAMQEERVAVVKMK